MPCFVSFKKNQEDLQCQFAEEANNLIEFDGQQWCKYHLPYENASGEKSAKAKWTEEEKSEFCKSIEQLQNTNPTGNAWSNFKYVVFPSKLSLQIGADFSYAEFREMVSFCNASVPNRATIFVGTIFFEKVEFLNLNFDFLTDFSHSIFENNACFIRSNFMSGVIFDEAIFSKEADFSHAIFQGKVLFKKALCKASITFFTNNSKDKILVDNASFHDAVDFSKTQFHGNASFMNRKFLAKTDFTDCIFKIAPDFCGCKLYQNTIFPPQENFEDTSTTDAAKAYKNLSLAVAQIKDRQNKIKFYALSKKSLKDYSEYSWIEKIIYWIGTAL